MGILENFETRLDRMVNGAFTRAFKSEVQPVEIAANLQRELDSRSSVFSRTRTVVPNVFVVELSEADHLRLSAYEGTVAAELTTLVRQYAQQQRYTFLGDVEVGLVANPALSTGQVRIRSEVREGPLSAGPVPVDTVGQPHLEVDGMAYPLKSVTLLGRAVDVDIRIDDPGVSRRHAEIVLGSDVTIRDLNSTNGTLVNGRMISQVVLQAGDRIQLGETTVTYRAR
jgi:hypothetical protein